MKAFATVLLLLASCDDMPRARTKSEIHLIARDAADAAATERTANLSSRIQELERQVEYLEAENRFQKAELERLSANDKHDTGSIESLFYNDCLFSSRLGLPWGDRHIPPYNCEK